MRAFLLAWIWVFVPTGPSWGAGTAPQTEPLALPPEWSLATLPGATEGISLTVLKRQALAPPARYRLVVIPGSGCTGWAPVAHRYFAGLLHAELLVLHKPSASIFGGLAPACSASFIQSDSLATWRDHAQAALQAHFSSLPTTRPTAPELPALLVGISEGAELLPSLAGSVPALAGGVMISAPGLDPREAGELQALRLGQGPAWQTLAATQASNASGNTLHQGRTLAYWRSFWQWSLARPLLDAPWPLLRVWGEADALVSTTAYDRFDQQARLRAAPWCDLRLPGADHGLARALPGARDGLQWLWAQLENWARNPAAGLCGQGLLAPE
jgi:hypothetical protein